MRKLLLYVMLIVVMCFTAGCGENGTEERLKTGEERALELKDTAEDAVEDMNENTLKIEETANQIEEE